MNEAHCLGSLLGSATVSAKFESGAYVPTVFDLREIVVRVVEHHRSIADRLTLSLEYSAPDLPVFVQGDITFTEQAFTNLVGNAIRYHHSEGHVAVVLDILDEYLVLQVLNDGPGMSAKDMARAMQRGERATRHEAENRWGVVLGCPLSRELPRSKRRNLDSNQANQL
jgi:signal transduction histidine kinase